MYFNQFFSTKAYFKGLYVTVLFTRNNYCGCEIMFYVIAHIKFSLWRMEGNDVLAILGSTMVVGQMSIKD